jgi:hypothetical protein
VIALFLAPKDPGAESPKEVTELLERMQRPALIRLLRCTIEFGSAGGITLNGNWHGTIDWCTLKTPTPDGPEVVIEGWPGVEIDWHDCTFTAYELAAEVGRQRAALGGAP